jgi:hypothetical protein
MRKFIPIREEFGPFREPTLEEILSDPIVKAVMRADSVDPGRLTDLLDWIADELQADFPASLRASGHLGQRPSQISISARSAAALRGV